jgi:hypothetical protein
MKWWSAFERGDSVIALRPSRRCERVPGPGKYRIGAGKGRPSFFANAENMPPPMRYRTVDAVFPKTPRPRSGLPGAKNATSRRRFLVVWRGAALPGDDLRLSRSCRRYPCWDLPAPGSRVAVHHEPHAAANRLEFLP